MFGFPPFLFRLLGGGLQGRRHACLGFTQDVIVFVYVCMYVRVRVCVGEGGSSLEFVDTMECACVYDHVSSHVSW